MTEQPVMKPAKGNHLQFIDIFRSGFLSLLILRSSSVKLLLISLPLHTQAEFAGDTQLTLSCQRMYTAGANPFEERFARGLRAMQPKTFIF